MPQIVGAKGLKNKYCLFLLLLILASTRLQAQIHLHEHDADDDNLIPVRYTQVQLLDLGSDSLFRVDTSLHLFHLYNTVFRNNFGFGDLGNLSTAMQPLVFDLSHESGFNLGFRYLDPFFFTANTHQLKYYKVAKPITSLRYVQGNIEETQLTATHTQNILPNWNFGIELNRPKSQGFYLNQATAIFNTRLFNWFHSKDYRYHVLADAVFDRVNNLENGGLLSEASFDTLSGAIRQANVLFYGNSGQIRAKNTVKADVFQLRQYYRFGKSQFFYTEAVDSLGNLLLDTLPSFFPQSQLVLHIKYHKYKNNFSANNINELAFDNYFLDSVSTHDSLLNTNFMIQLGFQSGTYGNQKDSIYYKPSKLIYDIGLKYGAHRVAWLNDYALYHNVSAYGLLGFRLKGFLTKVETEYFMNGYNQADNHLSFRTEKNFSDLLLSFDASLASKTPDFTSYYFFSNQYFWFNKSMPKTQSEKVSLNLGSKKSGETFLTVSRMRIRNYQYFNQKGLAEFFAGNLIVNRLDINKQLNYRKLYFFNRLSLQQGDLDKVIRVPNGALHSSVFVQGYTFKNALLAKVGVDFFYVTEYKANRYNPITHQFQLQDDIAIGNYPYFNVFFTGKLRSFYFFLLMQHVNMDLIGSRKYSSPLQPLQPRAFRFGIRWDLHN